MEVVRNNFSAGLIAKNRIKSIDSMDYHASFQELRNFYPTPQGSLRKRNGVSHVETINGNVRSYYRLKSENITLYTKAGDSMLYVDNGNTLKSVQTNGEIGLIFDARVLKNYAGLKKILISAQYRSFLYDIVGNSIQLVADHPYKTYRPGINYNKGDLVVMDDFTHIRDIQIQKSIYMGGDLIDNKVTFVNQNQFSGLISIKEYLSYSGDVTHYKKTITTPVIGNVGNFDLSKLFTGIQKGLYRKKVSGTHDLINIDTTFKEEILMAYPQKRNAEIKTTDGHIYELGVKKELQNENGDILSLTIHNYIAEPLSINSEWELVDGACLSVGGATWFKDQIVYVDKNHVKCGSRTKNSVLEDKNIFNLTVPPITPISPTATPEEREEALKLKEHEPKDYELMTKDFLPFKWILSGEVLMMGTASEEYIWRDTAIFPLKISMVGGSVACLNKDTVFIASRDARKLYKYLYSQEAKSYMAQQILPDLNRIIEGKIIKLVVKRNGDEGLYILTDQGELYLATEINQRYALSEINLGFPVKDITESEGELYITTNDNEKSKIFIVTDNHYDILDTGQASIKAYFKTTPIEMPFQDGSTLRRIKKLNGLYIESLDSKGGEVGVDGDFQPITYQTESIKINSERDKLLEIELKHEDVGDFELLCITVDLEV